jgi:hypothetical protein
MNESITVGQKHFTPAASLAALGVKLEQLHLFEPIDRLVHIEQKTVKYTPSQKLYDGFIVGRSPWPRRDQHTSAI